MSQLPLSGLVVLDLTQIFNGPYATFLLAAAGATVIKIEPPDGEHLRKRTVNKASQLPYAMLNAGKHSLRLNLKAPRGRQVLLDLVAKAEARKSKGGTLSAKQAGMVKSKGKPAQATAH